MWELIGTVGPGVTTFDDEGLEPGATYCYQITAFNDAGDSEPSNEACAKTVGAIGAMTLMAQGVFVPGAVQMGRFIPGAVEVEIGL